MLAAAILPIVAGVPAPALADGHAAAPPRTRLAWLATGTGIFSVDASARMVRYRGCDADTGRILDPA